METTFGLPQYRFPPAAVTLERMVAFARKTLIEGGIPVLLGYSLGKAQEILCALTALDAPVMLHPSVWEMTEVLAANLPSLPTYKPFDAATAAGHVLVFPPNQVRNGPLKDLPGVRTAVLTGWALNSSAKYRYRVDEAFPLSDHADYDELLATVKLVEPKRIYTVHGSTTEFATDLRLRGYDARSLEREDQLEFLF
jgi:DNA ligase-1